MKREEIENADWRSVERKIKAGIKGKGLVRGERAKFATYCVAFLKWIEKKTGKNMFECPDMAEELYIGCKMPQELADEVAAAAKECGWDASCEPKAAKVFGLDRLTAYLLYAKIDEKEATPRRVSELFLKLLDVRPEHSVIDICCGEGAFLADMALFSSRSRLHGIEFDASRAAVCAMRTMAARSAFDDDMVDLPAEVSVSSAFDDANMLKRFDFAFSNHPLGGIFSLARDDSHFLTKMRDCVSEYGTPSSLDWAFCSVAMELAAGRAQGKAAAVVAFGPLSSVGDRDVRERFVSKGWVEGVIALPSKVLSSTAVSLALLILSRGNEQVKFVDASERFELDEGCVEDIVRAWSGFESDEGDSAGDFACGVRSCDELARLDFDLNPVRVLAPVVQGCPLGELFAPDADGRALRRGISFRASAAEQGDDTVEAFLLNASGLEDRRIAFPLEERGSFPKGKIEKHLVREGDLIFPRVGSKLGVAEGVGDRRIVLSENLFAIALDPAKVDTWYAAAFLDSEEGRSMVKVASVGAVIKTLSMDALKDLRIPLPELDEQRRIGALWRDRLDRLAQLRRACEEAERSLHDGLWNGDRDS